MEILETDDFEAWFRQLRDATLRMKIGLRQLRLAQRAGVSPESFFRSSGDGSLDLAALLGIMGAMGMRLDVRIKQTDPEPA